MVNYYPLLRIVKTDNTSVYRYIWADKEYHMPADWIGFFRGCEGGVSWERYSHLGDDCEFPYNPWAETEPVVDHWTRNGKLVEEADPEWLAAQAKSDEEE